jgi:metal-responsive CopG/Arc/MetJ family transcriptional regulator
MALKQISLSMPENLFKASKDYTKELGYRNLQEFILELVRSRVMLDNIDRYKKIEQDMKAGKNVKKLKQKEALNYLKSL